MVSEYSVLALLSKGEESRGASFQYLCIVIEIECAFWYTKKSGESHRARIVDCHVSTSFVSHLCNSIQFRVWLEESSPYRFLFEVMVGYRNGENPLMEQVNNDCCPIDEEAHAETSHASF